MKVQLAWGCEQVSLIINYKPGIYCLSSIADKNLLSSTPARGEGKAAIPKAPFARLAAIIYNRLLTFLQMV
jgi:hypothetical protein